MTPEQAAAFIMAQAAMLNAELAIYAARDRQWIAAGCNPYQDTDYQMLFARYEGVLGHNAVLQLFQDVAR